MRAISVRHFASEIETVCRRPGQHTRGRLYSFCVDSSTIQIDLASLAFADVLCNCTIIFLMENQNYLIVYKCCYMTMK